MSSCCCRPLPVTRIAQHILASSFPAWQIFYAALSVVRSSCCLWDSITPWTEQPLADTNGELIPCLFPELTFYSQGKWNYPSFLLLVKLWWTNWLGSLWRNIISEVFIAFKISFLWTFCIIFRNKEIYVAHSSNRQTKF